MVIITYVYINRQKKAGLDVENKESGDSRENENVN